MMEVVLEDDPEALVYTKVQLVVVLDVDAEVAVALEL